MQPIWPNIAALVIAALFYTWRTWMQVCRRRDRILRERVAYMLWIVATGAGNPSRQVRRATV